MWWNLILGIVMTYIAWLLTPVPEPPEAGTLEDFNVPRTKRGAEIGLIYGTVWIRDPQVHWYGDFKTKKIREKQGKK